MSGTIRTRCTQQITKTEHNHPPRHSQPPRRVRRLHAAAMRRAARSCALHVCVYACTRALVPACARPCARAYKRLGAGAIERKTAHCAQPAAVCRVLFFIRMASWVALEQKQKTNNKTCQHVFSYKWSRLEFTTSNEAINNGAEASPSPNPLAYV